MEGDDVECFAGIDGEGEHVVVRAHLNVLI